MEQHTTTTTTTDPRDLATRAGYAANEGDWPRALSLYCQATDLAYEATRVLAENGQDWWAHQTASAARDYAYEAYVCAENVSKRNPRYAEYREQGCQAGVLAQDAEYLAGRSREEQAHTWG